MDECGHFSCTLLELMQYNGVGTKIASLVLYIAYGQNDVIPVDSYVIKCAIALKWVPDFTQIKKCTSMHDILFGQYHSL